MYSTKKELDKFYTKESVAIECISHLNLNDYDLIIEPSAGSGNFFKNIYSNNKIGLDLLPEAEGIIEQNWFDYQIDQSFQNVLIVGNPPFGKRNKLSVDFLKYACSFQNVKTIAFILPTVFKKHTLQKYVKSDFKLKMIVDLERDSFEIDGIPYHVPCSFFIFDKDSEIDLRFDPSLYVDTCDFTYAKSNDYSFFVMGAGPNVIKDIPEANNRGYYIKVREGVDENKVRENFKKGIWTGNSSANGGVYWLTKAELIKKYRDQFC
jgi:hypothetical protein